MAAAPEAAVSPAIRKKALRLVVDGAVSINIAGYVKGDHGSYVVAIRDGDYKCDCPARTPNCAHVVAVATLLKKARERP